MAKGNAQGVGGGSQIDLNPTRSSNKSLGIADYVVKGTMGDRSTMAADALGGDRQRGELKEGKTVARDNPNMNSGGRERRSSGDGLYASASHPEGTRQARQDMTIGGGTRSNGRYGGQKDGLGLSTKAKQPTVKKVQKGLNQAKGTTGRNTPQGTVGKKPTAKNQ